MRKGEPGGVGSDCEECGLAERQDSRVPPQNVERDRNRTEEKRSDENVDGVFPEQERADSDENESDEAEDAGAADFKPHAFRRKLPGRARWLAFSHGRSRPG